MKTDFPSLKSCAAQVPVSAVACAALLLCGGALAQTQVVKPPVAQY